MPLKMRKSAVTEPADGLCPIGTCMTLIGGMWTPNIIWYLSGGARRFSELRADVKPISAKMLSTRLKELEDNGVVSRLVVNSSPPSVEYSLTPLGWSLTEPLMALYEWAATQLSGAGSRPRRLAA